jgi:hypothetical protein
MFHYEAVTEFIIVLQIIVLHGSFSLYVHKILFGILEEIKKDISYAILSWQVLLLSKSNMQLASQ